MFSMAPNILLAPNMTQNAERKHRTQDANTTHFRSFDTHILIANSLTMNMSPCNNENPKSCLCDKEKEKYEWEQQLQLISVN